MFIILFTFVYVYFIISTDTNSYGSFQISLKKGGENMGKASENKATSKSVASKAAKVLSSPSSSKAAKSVAASALAQAVGRKGK